MAKILSFFKSSSVNAANIAMKSKAIRVIVPITVMVIIYIIIANAFDTNIKVAKITGQINSESIGAMNVLNSTAVKSEDNVPLLGTSEFGFSLTDIPEYDGNEIVEVHSGEAYFTASEKKYVQDFATYSVDSYGRPGQVFALISPETISYEYNNIGDVYPDRYLQLDSMVMAEEAVYNTVIENGYAVLYRVTPIYADNGSTDSYGMLVEAYSLDDDGCACNFCIFCFNNAGY